MKKLLLAACAMVVFALGVTTLQADPASVIRVDGICNLAGFGAFECTFQRVSNDGGEVHYWVRGEATTPPAETTHVSDESTGQICAGDATSFEGVVTKSGKINIQCRN